MYDFEKRLEKLLAFFFEERTNSVTPIQSIPAEFQNPDLQKMLAVLEHLKFVIPLTVDYQNRPVTFPHVYSVTLAGMYFAYSSSFVDNTIIKKKECKLFYFSHFTMKWNTAIALLALIVAIIALFI